MTLYKWSQTAAADATADTSINWQEGQAPSSINDSARAMMAAMAKYRDDSSGKNNATGGTSTAYTVASNQTFDSIAHMAGMEISIVVHATNGTAPTLNVDSLGGLPINMAAGVAVPAGTMIANSVYSLFCNVSEWLLKDFYGNPFNIPIGGSMDYWGPTVPNSNFAFPMGQAISRTSYVALFAIVGTTYGAGDGSTTFNLPDVTGRVTAMKEAAATRLTATYFGGNSTVLGVTGGGESKALITGNLPPYTPAGSIGGTAAVSPANVQVNTSNITVSTGGSNTIPLSNPQPLSVSGSSFSFTGASQGGTSAPFATVPPTIICNKILRII